MAKTILKRKARILRKQGLGVKTIAHKLHVSSSTVSQWCKDIELTPDQVATLKIRQRDPYYGQRLIYVKKQQATRQEKITRLSQEGIDEIGKLTKRELFIAGIALYWAEGFKKDNQVGFANLDQRMARFYIKWLHVCCDIPKNRLKIRVGANEAYKDAIKDLELYWSRMLSIPREQFQKPFFQKVKWKKQYDHPENYHGVIRIRVSKSTDLLRKIHGWIEGLKLQD